MTPEPALLTIFALAFSAATSLAQDLYEVPDVGSFTNYAYYTFEDAFPEGPGQLHASTEFIRDTQENDKATHDHVYDPENVMIEPPYLVLRVKGQAMDDPANISAGQVTTYEADYLYGSVRTTAIFSSNPGTVNGIFFYYSGTQEIDMEFISNISAATNEPVNTGQPSLGAIPPLQLTNQPGGEDAYATTMLPDDAETAEHEYRIDWVPGRSDLFIDARLVHTFTKNVPSTAGSWVWNNWANGDPFFSTGPPAEDSLLRIKSIEMYFNTSSA